MLYYLLLIIATILFAFQFFFNQQYQRLRGNSMEASLTFSANVHCVICLMMLAINGFVWRWSWFSAGMALVRAVMDLTFGYCAIQALACANLSVYSTFSMLGGMLLPFFYGIALGGEEFTLSKFLCCLLISLSLFLTVQPGKHGRKSVFYYFAVFTLNGLYGVVAAIHQKFPGLAVDSQSFSAISSFFTVILAVVIFGLKMKKLPMLKKPEVKFVVLFGIFCGIGNLLLLIALKYLNASVQYPIVTGGTMVVSTLICLIRKEKLTKRDVLATAIAFGATILIIL